MNWPPIGRPLSFLPVLNFDCSGRPGSGLARLVAQAPLINHRKQTRDIEAARRLACLSDHAVDLIHPEIPGKAGKGMAVLAEVFNLARFARS